MEECAEQLIFKSSWMRASELFCVPGMKMALAGLEDPFLLPSRRPSSGYPLDVVAMNNICVGSLIALRRHKVIDSEVCMYTERDTVFKFTPDGGISGPGPPLQLLV